MLPTFALGVGRWELGVYADTMPSFPWKTILKNAPMLLGAADALLAQARQRSVATEIGGDINVLRQHVARLEEQQRSSAELVRQLADQLSAMTTAAEQSESRLRIAYALAITGTVLGIAGCVIGLLR
jgi:hypothetical protein